MDPFANELYVVTIKNRLAYYNISNFESPIPQTLKKRFILNVICDENNSIKTLFTESLTNSSWYTLRGLNSLKILFMDRLCWKLVGIHKIKVLKYCILVFFMYALAFHLFTTNFKRWEVNNQLCWKKSFRNLWKIFNKLIMPDFFNFVFVFKWMICLHMPLPQTYKEWIGRVRLHYEPNN